MLELIRVGMADYKTGTYPNSLISYGLGSCIGIALFDPITKVGGLAHIMLPDSTQARTSENPAKFADTAIPLMLQEMIRLGAVRTRVVAKIAGGAQMFKFANATDIMRVGERNAEATIKTLKELDIRIIASDTGGNYGRTVELKLDTGIYKIKTIDKGQKEL